GVPVLMADIPMSREMFDRYDVPASTYRAWLFDPRDHRSLAEMIEHVLEHRQEIYQQQAKVVERLRSYDFTRMAQAYHDAYRRLAGGGALPHLPQRTPSVPARPALQTETAMEDHRV